MGLEVGNAGALDRLMSKGTMILCLVLGAMLPSGRSPGRVNLKLAGGSSS